MLLEGVPRAAVRVARSAGYWVGSVVGGGGGTFFGIIGYHSASFGVFFLAFGVFEYRTIFLSSFVHSLKILSRWVGWLLCFGPRGVVATSLAGVHKSYAMHKSPTVHFNYSSCRR
jgi:hypothetical protein